MIEQDGDYFDLNPNTGDIKVCIVINIGHCKEYPTMHYFKNSLVFSIRAYMCEILAEYFWKLCFIVFSYPGILGLKRVN